MTHIDRKDIAITRKTTLIDITLLGRSNCEIRDSILRYRVGSIDQINIAQITGIEDRVDRLDRLRADESEIARYYLQFAWPVSAFHWRHYSPRRPLKDTSRCTQSRSLGRFHTWHNRSSVLDRSLLIVSRTLPDEFKKDSFPWSILCLFALLKNLVYWRVWFFGEDSLRRKYSPLINYNETQDFFKISARVQYLRTYWFNNLIFLSY